MPRLPQVTGPEAVRAFVKSGYILTRIRSSHHILTHPVRPLLSVPVHGNQPLGAGLLRSLIRDAGLTVAEFLALLD
ncbi:MAG: type II toxin-antitoxin system HicA family toxin [Gemmataceae bacterium]|nr:type II toxin-antitoxin system HicA family toxin [Gemmataceae bacterium]